jgi:hypothetical protein
MSGRARLRASRLSGETSLPSLPLRGSTQALALLSNRQAMMRPRFSIRDGGLNA